MEGGKDAIQGQEVGHHYYAIGGKVAKLQPVVNWDSDHLSLSETQKVNMKVLMFWGYILVGHQKKLTRELKLISKTGKVG